MHTIDQARSDLDKYLPLIAAALAVNAFDRARSGLEKYLPLIATALAVLLTGTVAGQMLCSALGMYYWALRATGVHL